MSVIDSHYRYKKIRLIDSAAPLNRAHNFNTLKMSYNPIPVVLNFNYFKGFCIEQNMCRKMRRRRKIEKRENPH